MAATSLPAMRSWIILSAGNKNALRLAILKNTNLGQFE
jgi:hypothetical protein